MINKRITIVIPTHNRYQYLTRALDYYKDNSINIIICDSSKNAYPENKLLGRFDYYHFPNMPYIEKLKIILRKVKTPYCGFCGDDDFIVPKSIITCVRFLDKNLDYSSAQGKYISFKKNKKVIFRPLYEQNCENMKIDSENPSRRITQQFSPYMNQFYAIHRKRTLVDTFEICHKYDFPLDILELMLSIFASIEGKHKIFPIFYGARELTDNSTGDKIKRLDLCLDSEKFRDKYNIFVEAAATFLSIRTEMNLEEAKEAINTALNTYLIEFLPFYYKDSMVKNIIRKTLPRRLQKQLATLAKLHRGYRNIVDYNLEQYFANYRVEAKLELDKILYYIEKHRILEI